MHSTYSQKRGAEKPRKGVQCRSVSLDKPLPSASQTPEPAEPKIMGREAIFFFSKCVIVSLVPRPVDLRYERGGTKHCLPVSCFTVTLQGSALTMKVSSPSY